MANLKAGVTEKQLDELVKKHGALNDTIKLGSVQSLTNKSERLFFYFKKPDKHVVGYSSSHLLKGDFNKAKAVFVTECLLHADPELTAVGIYADQYEMAMGTLIGDAFEIPAAQLEKI